MTYSFTIEIWLKKGWGKKGKVLNELNKLPFLRDIREVDKKHSQSIHRLGPCDIRVESYKFPNTTVCEYVVNHCKQHMSFYNYCMELMECVEWEDLE